MNRAKHNGHTHHHVHHATPKHMKRKVIRKYAAIAPIMLSQLARIKRKPIISLEIATGVALLSAAAFYLIKRTKL